METDGSSQTRISNSSTNLFRPSLSPDGTAMVVRGNSISESDRQRPPAGDPRFGDRSPAWSADGTELAFETDRDGNRKIYRVAPHGSGIQRVTTDTAADSVLLVADPPTTG